MTTDIATTRGTYVSVGQGDWDERTERFYAGEQLEDPPRTQPPLTPLERQQAEYGGVSVGAAFFGWIGALGVTALLVAAVAAAVLVLGVAPDLDRAGGLVVGTTDLVLGAVVATTLLVLGCYAGGYAAGRLVRFDGGRQGVVVWVLVTASALVAAGVAVVLEAQYGLRTSPSLPEVAVADADLLLGAGITAGVAALLTLLVAIGGGKLGVRYHAKVDRAGLDPAEPSDAPAQQETDSRPAEA